MHGVLTFYSICQRQSLCCFLYSMQLWRFRYHQRISLRVSLFSTHPLSHSNSGCVHLWVQAVLGPFLLLIGHKSHILPIQTIWRYFSHLEGIPDALAWEAHPCLGLKQTAMLYLNKLSWRKLESTHSSDTTLINMLLPPGEVPHLDLWTYQLAAWRLVGKLWAWSAFQQKLQPPYPLICAGHIWLTWYAPCQVNIVLSLVFWEIEGPRPPSIRAMLRYLQLAYNSLK